MKIAVRESRRPTAATSRSSRARGVLYRMCGLGEKCAIASGQAVAGARAAAAPRGARARAVLLPRPRRHRARRRVHAAGQGQGSRRSRCTSCAATSPASSRARCARRCPRRCPTPDTIATAPNTPAVQQLTFANLFRFSLTVGNQDANVFLVLEPLPTDSLAAGRRLYSPTALPGGVIGNSPGSGPGIQGSSPCPAVSRRLATPPPAPSSRGTGASTRPRPRAARRACPARRSGRRRGRRSGRPGGSC